MYMCQMHFYGVDLKNNLKFLENSLCLHTCTKSISFKKKEKSTFPNLGNIP